MNITRPFVVIGMIKNVASKIQVLATLTLGRQRIQIGTRTFASFAVGLFAASMTVSAEPVLYNTTYTATVGPNGTGSFNFDSVAGEMTDFVWDFGSGITGGMSDITSGVVFGDTQARFVFEILSETDAHSGVDCINACSVGFPVIGSAPGGATSITFGGGLSPAQYIFTPTGSPFINGIISIEVADATVPITIDIKPGSDPNCFNMNGNGVIPVAILGSDTLNVVDIDTSALFFAGLEVRVRGKKGPMCHGEDLNGDEFLDLVCQFEDDASMWTPDSSSEATLAGTLLDGTTEFEGSDSICVTQEVEEPCPFPPCEG